MDFIDYYQVLQVRPTADADVIARAYKVLIAKHHPDVGGDTATAQALNEAYAVLGDPARRAEYDREIRIADADVARADRRRYLSDLRDGLARSLVEHEKEQRRRLDRLRESLKTDGR